MVSLNCNGKFSNTIPFLIISLSTHSFAIWFLNGKIFSIGVISVSWTTSAASVDHNFHRNFVENFLLEFYCVKSCFEEPCGWISVDAFENTEVCSNSTSTIQSTPIKPYAHQRVGTKLNWIQTPCCDWQQKWGFCRELEIRGKNFKTFCKSNF